MILGQDLLASWVPGSTSLQPSGAPCRRLWRARLHDEQEGVTSRKTKVFHSVFFFLHMYIFCCWFFLFFL